MLAMVNYEVDASLLRPLVPPGTELDDFNGRTLVSMVGFRFLKTKVFGFRFPFHTDFDEVNLRFYVRRPNVPGEDRPRRGTVFIKEIVPRWIIATTARLLYNEPYITCPMRHRIDQQPGGGPVEARYDWRHRGLWGTLRVRVPGGEPTEAAAGSEQEFITEHYWGYNRQRSGKTLEYQVEHPRWRMWRAADPSPGSGDVEFSCDVAALYGAGFAPFLSAAPSSAFLVEGSAVQVRRGRAL